MDSPNGTYQIVLLRHGESEGNARGYFQGHADFELTETGIAQARALAQRWSSEEVTFDRIRSSPLARARQTAEIIGEALSVDVEFDSDLMEWDNGLLSGLTHDEAEERFPRPDFMRPYDPIGKTGESRWELYLRAGRALQNLINEPPGRYLVVAHGGILNMMLYAILGIVPQANFQGSRFRFHNTSFASLVYDSERHNWLLERLNDREHWKEGET
jgi:2,3-bisphosphoglycerate-dependent phosphoglycerate mutase